MPNDTTTTEPATSTPETATTTPETATTTPETATATLEAAAAAPETAATTAPETNTAQQAPNADAVMDSYKMDSEDPAPQPENEQQNTDRDDYQIEWPDGVEADPGFAEMATTAAKATGLDGKAAGAYTAAVINAIKQQERENFIKNDTELKEQWGSDYQTNMRACKTFLARHAKESGLTQQDVAVLESPKGFRLLYSFMQSTGEQPAHGTEKPTMQEKSWAHSVMHDPSHSDYRAFHDIEDTRYNDVHARYNKIVYGW